MGGATLAVAGDGYGDGSGYGYGYGYGDGSGYGYGYGYGYGDGDGSGSGYGYGYGYGSGYGSGYGYGSLTEMFAGHPLVAGATSAGAKVEVAFWKSNAKGLPANGGTASKRAAPGLVQEVPGPLRLCSANALHATTAPNNWQGERTWLVALFEPIERSGDKLGSLKRLIVAELTHTDGDGP